MQYMELKNTINPKINKQLKIKINFLLVTQTKGTKNSKTVHYLVNKIMKILKAFLAKMHTYAFDSFNVYRQRSR